MSDKFPAHPTCWQRRCSDPPSHCPTVATSLVDHLITDLPSNKALFHDLIAIVIIAYSVLTLYDLESDYVNARSVH